MKMKPIKDMYQDVKNYYTDYPKRVRIAGAALLTGLALGVLGGYFICRNNQPSIDTTSQNPTSTLEYRLSPTMTPLMPSPTFTLTPTPLPSATPTINPRYDGHVYVEGLGFLGNLPGDIDTARDTDFYRARNEQLCVRAREATPNNDMTEWTLGDVISENISCVDGQGVINLDIRLSQPGSTGYVIFEAGTLNEQGEFVYRPFVSLSASSGGFRLSENDSPIHMYHTTQRVDIGAVDGVTYELPYQVWRLREENQPNNQGIALDTYTDFIFFRLGLRGVDGLEELNQRVSQVESPIKELLQWIGIVATGDNSYRLTSGVGYTFSIYPTIPRFRVVDYSNSFNIWEFSDISNNLAEGRFSCYPVAEQAFRQGSFPHYVMSPVMPVTIGIDNKFTEQVPEIALVCGEEPTPTPERQRPTPEVPGEGGDGGDGNPTDP